MLLEGPGFFALTERGGRERNEDAILALDLGEHFLFAVADGLGGHACGEVASGIAIAELSRIDAGTVSRSDAELLLLQAFAEANLQIVRYNLDHGVNSGTTLTACLATRDGRCTIGNLGDSRVYVIGEKTCWHTRDHSYLQQLIDSGELRERDAIRHPRANIITRALGLERGCVPDIYDRNAGGKTLVLTSDGIHDFIEPSRFRDLVRGRGPGDAARALVDAAVSGGSTDNLSVIVCQFGEKPA
ncbi:MAG TPA: protein phosphatase 2C domain-containing protein [Methanomicrobiales archaeon]|nr:protein phosphatase 2C domain-containing protein [Methanomicrobiales archaeon]